MLAQLHASEACYLGYPPYPPKEALFHPLRPGSHVATSVKCSLFSQAVWAPTTLLTQLTVALGMFCCNLLFSYGYTNVRVDVILKANLSA